MLYPKAALFLVVASVVALGCSDGKASLSTDISLIGPGHANIATFACGVSYDATTYTDETELSAYGVEPSTDTVHVCEQWTGSDYNIETRQIGSSDPVTDYSEDVISTIYQNGSTTPYNASDAAMEPAQEMASSTFQMVDATPEEQQASYSDPYYAVVADPNPANCGANHCPDQLRASSSVSVDFPTTPSAPNIDRLALRALVAGKSEIAPSQEAYRRFRGVSPSGVETIISFDPLTQLIRRIETTSGTTTTRADLTWSLGNGKYVRDRMTVLVKDVVNGKPVQSNTSVVLRNVQLNGVPLN